MSASEALRGEGAIAIEPFIEHDSTRPM